MKISNKIAKKSGLWSALLGGDFRVQRRCPKMEIWLFLIRKGWHIYCICHQVLLSGFMSWSYPKGERRLIWWKVKKNKTRMILPIRAHPIGHWEVGHMTNYQKWSKTKVVALHCSFLNLVELCSEMLLLWRYEVKDFEKCRIFFCFLHFSQWKQNQITWFQHI